MISSDNTIVIENKVAKSGLITIDLEKLVGEVSIIGLDIKDFLYMELLLREKDFREALNQHNWTQYKGSVLAVHCSTDAIIPSWAYMLVTIHARDSAKMIFINKPEDVADAYFRLTLGKHNWAQYHSKRVLLKGCSDNIIPQSAYAYATLQLMEFADRIMYGEACSFVPVWRRPKESVIKHP
jgi:hypothetical protein